MGSGMGVGIPSLFPKFLSLASAWPAPEMRATSCTLASRLQARSSSSSALSRSSPAVERMVLL